MFKINEINYKFFLGSKKIWFLDKYEVIDISYSVLTKIF